MLVRSLLVAGTVGLAVPAAASAAPAWTCSASAGWLAANGQRVDARGVGGDPCPVVRSEAVGTSGGSGSLAATGSMSADGGAAAQTTDARNPKATVDAKAITIHNPDGKLTLNAADLSAQAAASCDANRGPVLSGSGAPGVVTLNGRSIDTAHEYSEPGVGVNGAPLFGKITIRFNEVAKSGDIGLSRRAIHLLVTDRDGVLLFEAVAGEVAVGRDGPVCEPPPVCPPGQEPNAGRCIDVTVAPLPTPQSPAPQPPAAVPLPRHPRPAGCADTTARAGQVSVRRLRAATLCLINVERKRRHIGRLRISRDLTLAAIRHARDMVAHRYFAHDEPSGRTVFDRILSSGYLERYGRWRVGENLGWGWGSGGTPAAMVSSWMRSRLHRRNMLDARFHDVGIALRPGSPGRKRAASITYVTDFGGYSS